MNLHPFVQSLIDKDAPEIDHEEVLWNLTSELIKRVDGVFDQVQLRTMAGQDEGDLITSDVVNTVNMLRTLRHFVREVARREEIRQIVKGSEPTKNSDEHNFEMLVDDVDMVRLQINACQTSFALIYQSNISHLLQCLHEFRYRRSKVIPTFKARRAKALKNVLSKGTGRCKDVIKRDMSKFFIGNKPVVAFNSSLENNYTSLVNADVKKHFPNASKENVGEFLIEQLVPGDKIFVRLEQKCAKAEVIEILPQMKSAYISFEDYPSVYDEYQPIESLRLTTRAEIPEEDIKPGLLVLDLSNSNEYRARIVSTLNSTMARVKIIVSQHEMVRLVSPAMILGRYVPLQKRSKNLAENAGVESPGTKTDRVVERAATLPIMRPTQVGQIVDVYWRGAARVIRIYGDPIPTHVDVRFLLGNSHEDYMIPIESVKLAPELDPDSGRCLRQISKQIASSGDNAHVSTSIENPPRLGGMSSSPSSDTSVIEIL